MFGLQPNAWVAAAAPAVALPPATPPATPPAGGGAPPGKRDDYGRVYNEATPGDKGKRYVSRSRRGGDRRKGKRQALNALSGNQQSGKTRRSYLPGMTDLYKFSEGLEPNYYDEQEKQLFQETVEIKKLINSLEKVEKTSDET